MDSRNSRYAAWEGSLFQVRGYFPRVFEAIEFKGEHNIPIVRGQSARLKYFGSSRVGSAPYFELVENSLHAWIPGQREGRFRDNAAYGISPEWRYRMGSFVTVAAFGSLGTVGTSFGAVFGQNPKWGAGLASEFSFSNFLKDRTRLEVGVYDRELIFQLGLVG